MESQKGVGWITGRLTEVPNLRLDDSSLDPTGIVGPFQTLESAGVLGSGVWVPDIEDVVPGEGGDAN